MLLSEVRDPDCGAVSVADSPKHFKLVRVLAGPAKRHYTLLRFGRPDLPNLTKAIAGSI